jgi:hypothetical protein
MDTCHFWNAHGGVGLINVINVTKTNNLNIINCDHNVTFDDVAILRSYLIFLKLNYENK